MDQNNSTADMGDYLRALTSRVGDDLAKAAVVDVLESVLDGRLAPGAQLKTDWHFRFFS